ERDASYWRERWAHEPREREVGARGQIERRDLSLCETEAGGASDHRGIIRRQPGCRDEQLAARKRGRQHLAKLPAVGDTASQRYPGASHLLRRPHHLSDQDLDRRVLERSGEVRPLALERRI